MFEDSDFEYELIELLKKYYGKDWEFTYENQEGGFLNRVELGSAFKSYSKHLADSLKAMWKSGEI